MPKRLQRADRCRAQKSKNPGEFPHRGSRMGTTGSGSATVADDPEQSCTGLCVFRIADSRTWHVRSFPVKNWLIKIDEVRFCGKSICASNNSSACALFCCYFTSPIAAQVSAFVIAIGYVVAIWRQDNHADLPERFCRSTNNVPHGMARKARTAAAGSGRPACQLFPGCNPCMR